MEMRFNESQGFSVIGPLRCQRACCWRFRIVEQRSQCVVCSVQRDSHANAVHTRTVARASYQALVAVARMEHLPAKAPARAAHPHST